MNFFENLAGALQIGGVLALSPLLRGWYNRWGAGDDDVNRAMPGDELAPAPDMVSTRALTIQATRPQVWAWLVQIGQGRGGFYSYEGLENLAGCQIHNATRMMPELQTLQVGDLVRLGPPGYPCYATAAVDAPHALALVSADPQSGQAVTWNPQAQKGYSIATWQFLLLPLAGSATRLLVRQRLSYSRDLAWVWRLTEPVSFVMERKMMLELRRLAEQV